jgi:transcriptional regulator with XRE-family HTH domain
MESPNHTKEVFIMIGDDIRKLRAEKGMTQKEIADRLFVTAQAVSRWENGEVEPSLNTITELAKIFEVSVDALLGVATESEPAPEAEQEPQQEPEPQPEPTIIIEKEYVYKEPPKQVLALCHRCNSPIYDQKEIVRVGGEVWCKKCDHSVKSFHKSEAVRKEERRRVLSFIFGGLFAVLCIVLGIVNAASDGSLTDVVVGIVLGYAGFALISCWLLCNTFVGEMMGDIFSWAFVDFPGVIFSLDFDGLLFLIAVKILFFVLGILLALLCGALALIVGALVSMFVYPYAIVKSYRHPEDNDLDII